MRTVRKKSTLDPGKALPTVAAAVIPPRPWADMSKGERLSYNVDLSLDFTRKLLELPFDPEDLKLMGHQKDAALTLISQQIRIDQEKMRAAREGATGKLEDFYRGLDVAPNGEKS